MIEISSETLLKFYGPLGLIIVGLALFLWKWVLPRLDKREEEYRAVLLSVVDDARKERDLVRQLRETEVDKFLQSLKFRDEQFRSVADAISEKRQRQTRR